MILIIAIAALLRFYDLGAASFWIDEYLQVGAAQGWLAQHEPRLADGILYIRAFPQTLLVALSFGLFGISEVSARLPSALLGVLLVAAVYRFGRDRLGREAALTAAALVAASPMLVWTSRVARMYSLLALLQVATLAAYDRGFERNLPNTRRGAPCALAAVLLFGFTYRYVHLLAVHLPLGLLLYWCLRAGVSPRSRYSIYLSLTLGAAILAYAGGWLDPAEMLRKAQHLPAWAAALKLGPGYYVNWWAEAYPWLWWSVPIASFVLLQRHGWFGCLLALQVAVPLAMHSLLLPWKQLRYVADLVPFLALALAPAGAVALAAIARRAGVLIESARSWNTVARTLLHLALVQSAMLALALIFWPALRSSIRLADIDEQPRWREAFAFVAAHAKEGDAVIATLPYAAEFYLRRAGRELRQDPPGMQAADRHDLIWAAEWPLEQPLNSFREFFARWPRAWFVCDEARFASPLVVTGDVARWLESQAIRHSPPEAAGMHIYEWQRPQPYVSR